MVTIHSRVSQSVPRVWCHCLAAVYCRNSHSGSWEHERPAWHGWSKGSGVKNTCLYFSNSSRAENFAPTCIPELCLRLSPEDPSQIAIAVLPAGDVATRMRVGGSPELENSLTHPPSG